MTSGITMSYHLALVTISVMVVSTLGANACPKGWIHYDAEAKCLKVFKMEYNFEQSKNICKKYGAALVRIESRAKNEFISGMIDIRLAIPYVWIGVRDIGNGAYGYMDGDKLTFSNWEFGNPKLGLSCGRMFITKSKSHPFYTKWSTFRCQVYLSPVCEMDETKTTDHRSNSKSRTTHTPGSRKTSQDQSNKGRQDFSASCPKGWTLFQRDNVCLKLYSQKMYYRPARGVCRKEKGNIVTVTDEVKAASVTELIPQGRVFIGIRDEFRNGSLRNQDGTLLGSFQPWENEAVKKGYCVYMDNDGKWSRGTCLLMNAFVCERPLLVSEPKDNCPEGWTAYHRDNKCLKINKEMMKWEAARSKCKELYADLVVLYDETKADFIWEMVKPNSPYIGLQKDCNGVWRRLDGTEMNNTKWFAYKHQTATDECARLDEQWAMYLAYKRVSCSESHISVCEMDMPQ